MISMRIGRAEDLARDVWKRLAPDVKWALVAMGVRDGGDVSLGELRRLDERSDRQ